MKIPILARISEKTYFKKLSWAVNDHPLTYIGVLAIFLFFLWEITKIIISLFKNETLIELLQFIQGLGNATLISILIIAFLTQVARREIAQKKLRRAEDQIRQLMQIEKIAALNHVVERLGHEINNPLSFLLLDLDRQQELYSELILMIKLFDQIRTDSKKEVLTQIEKIEGKFNVNEAINDLQDILISTKEGLNRISQVVKEIRMFSSLETSIGKLPCSLNKISKLTLNMVRNQSNGHIDFQEDLDEDIPSISLDANRVAQGILNLILNSIHAIKNKGVIKVKTFVKFNHEDSTDYVCVSIKDNGIGIDEEILPYLFRPYFTTKKEGTGLGLKIVKNVVEDHNGKIEIKSEKNKGTEITLLFPK